MAIFHCYVSSPEGMLGRPRQDVACGAGAGDGVPCRAVLGLYDTGLLEEMGWVFASNSGGNSDG